MIELVKTISPMSSVSGQAEAAVSHGDVAAVSAASKAVTTPQQIKLEKATKAKKLKLEQASEIEADADEADAQSPADLVLERAQAAALTLLKINSVQDADYVQQANATQAAKRSSKRARRRLSEDDQRLVRQILDEKYDVMLDPVFDEPDAEAQVFDQAIEIPAPDTSWYHPVMDRNWDETRHGQVAAQASIVLTAKQEKALFLKFNLCRLRVNEYKQAILIHQEKDGVSGSDLEVEFAQTLLNWHTKAEAYRTQIADTNLALVLAMAKRSRMTDADFAEMVSEGNMALLRAIDKFNVSRGFKFSTYACRAIIKAFSRQGLKNAKYRSLFPADFDPKLERSNWDQTRRELQEEDCVDELKEVIDDNRAELSDLEQAVITHRFALEQMGETGVRPMTLEQVGKRIGVTKERVRQIQNRALKKLKQTMEDDFLH